MSLVTDLNGKQAEAFDLIMRKQFAWDIIEGRKRLEFRDLSNFYMRKFVKNVKTWDTVELDFIHFRDYGNTWFLDVHIASVDTVALLPENLPYFHEYGHHEFDEEIAGNEGKQPKDAGYLFCLPVDAIINTNLDDMGKIRAISRLPIITLSDLVASDD